MPRTLRGNARPAIAAGHRLTAEAGASVLREGGNAVDAAVAALWMACVCEPVLASPGGGGFATAFIGGKPVALDFFVDAPGQKKPVDDIEFCETYADFGTMRQAFHVGSGASAVPGYVPGLFELHRHFGRVPMPELAAPAVSAARDGVMITAFQAKLFRVVEPIITFTSQAASLFGRNAQNDALHDVGALMRNSELADALDAIAREGSRIATHGEIAGLMTGQCDQHGGHLRSKDLETYEPVFREPLVSRIGDWQLWTNPPPALGGALVAAMCAGIADDAAGSHAHRIAKAVDTVDRFWREAPQDAGRLAGMATGAGHVASRGTTHVSVADANGDVVAITVSNGEGNGRMVPGCGFMINNMLGEEDVNPGGFHSWTPGERLSSMMAPSVARSPAGDLAALGSGGSNRIRTAIVQVLANIAKRGLPLEEAVHAPRLHVEKGFCDFEDTGEDGLFTGEDREEIISAFPEHRAWSEKNLYFGGVHAVRTQVSGAAGAAGDERREGAAIIL